MTIQSVLLSLLTVSAFEISLQYKEELVPSLPNEALSAMTTSVPVRNRVNIWYSGTLYVGTPAKPFSFLFDTVGGWT